MVTRGIILGSKTAAAAAQPRSPRSAMSAMATHAEVGETFRKKLPPFASSMCAVSDTCFAEKIFQHQQTLLKCLTFFQKTFIEKKMTFQSDTCQLQVPLKINEKIYRIQKYSIIVNGRVNNSQNVNSAQWFQQKKVQL